jgi:hypothetical protein
MSEAEMMRRGAAQANHENDMARVSAVADQQIRLLEEIRDLLKMMVKPDQIDPRFRR